MDFKKKYHCKRGCRTVDLNISWSGGSFFSSIGIISSGNFHHTKKATQTQACKTPVWLLCDSILTEQIGTGFLLLNLVVQFPNVMRNCKENAFSINVRNSTAQEPSEASVPLHFRKVPLGLDTPVYP